MRLRSALWSFVLVALAVVPVTAQSADVEARREQIVSIAEAYASHPWRASADNTLHGEDADGVHVDTPDVSAREDGFHADGRLNIGVPYKWGGFHSLEQFDEGVADGLPAGQLTDGVKLDASSQALGVDCSGFVARCWQLPTKQSTRSLGRLCFELDSYDELLPGDLINKFDAHAMVFVDFVDETKTEVRVIEATLPKVLENTYPAEKLAAAGFRPFRYKPLDPRWVDVRLDVDAPLLATHGQQGTWIPAEVPPAGEPVVVDGLSDARAGDWTRYRFGNAGSDVGMDVTRAVSAVGADGIQLQSTSAFGDGELQTLEELPATADIADRLLALRDNGQAYEGLTVVSRTVTPGRWQLDDIAVPAQRLEIEVEGHVTMRSQAVPFRLSLDAIVSPEIPLEGVISLEQAATYVIEGEELTLFTVFALQACGRGEETAAG